MCYCLLTAVNNEWAVTMKNILVRRCQVAVCLLATSSYINLALADWSIDQSKRGYNQGYGDFPPEDINQQLFGHLNTSPQQEQEQSQAQDINSDTAALNNNQADVSATQNYPVYDYQQPSSSYGAYNRGGRYQQNTIPGNYPDMNFSGPWNNNGSNFTGPWNNRGSGFSSPWNNNGSSFSGPRNNNGSNFNMPWGNNNGSGFNPMGNGNSWGW